MNGVLTPRLANLTSRLEDRVTPVQQDINENPTRRELREARQDTPSTF